MRCHQCGGLRKSGTVVDTDGGEYVTRLDEISDHWQQVVDSDDLKSLGHLLYEDVPWLICNIAALNRRIERLRRLQPQLWDAP